MTDVYYCERCGTKSNHGLSSNGFRCRSCGYWRASPPKPRLTEDAKRVAADNRRRRRQGEGVLLYGSGNTRDALPTEDQVTDVLADIGHAIGPEVLRKLAKRAAEHVEAELREARTKSRLR